MSTRAAVESGMAVAAERPRARTGLRAVDYLTLFLIGLVVVLVSLPRLRRFALRENELDAIALLRALGDDLAELGGAAPEGGLAALLASNARHENRFEDLEVLAGGRLRRHGYLFDSVRTRTGGFALRGWPWEHGHTGLGAFVFSTERGLVATSNAEGESDGPARPPDVERALDPVAGWPVYPR